MRFHHRRKRTRRTGWVIGQWFYRRGRWRKRALGHSFFAVGVTGCFRFWYPFILLFGIDTGLCRYVRGCRNYIEAAKWTVSKSKFSPRSYSSSIEDTIIPFFVFDCVLAAKLKPSSCLHLKSFLYPPQETFLFWHWRQVGFVSSHFSLLALQVIHPFKNCQWMCRLVEIMKIECGRINLW